MPSAHLALAATSSYGETDCHRACFRDLKLSTPLPVRLLQGGVVGTLLWHVPERSKRGDPLARSATGALVQTVGAASEYARALLP